MKEITRNYTMEDEAMLVKAEVVSNLLADDLATFTPKFPFVNATYQTSMASNIDTANALRLDAEVVADIKVITANLNAKVLEGYDELTTLGIYAKLAYPNNSTMQNVFGQNGWAVAKSDQEKMMNALEAASTKATEEPYHSDILAKGYTDPQIINLLSIASSIRSLNLLQESAIANRPVSTQGRIMIYNNVWEQLRTLNICSKVAFKDDPAKLEQYMLYPNSTQNTKVNITVVDKDTQTPLPNVMVILSNTSLASKTTDANGKADFASVNMPDLLDVQLTLNTSNATHNNLSVAPGGDNVFELEL